MSGQLRARRQETGRFVPVPASGRGLGVHTTIAGRAPSPPLRLQGGVEDRWAAQQAERAEEEANRRAQEAAGTKKERIALQVGMRLCRCFRCFQQGALHAVCVPLKPLHAWAPCLAPPAAPLGPRCAVPSA